MRPGVLGWMLIGMLGTGSYLAPRPWRLMLLALLVMAVVAVGRWHHRRTLVTIVRRLRHRQANQMQVIQGWLQLGRTNRVEEYVGRVTERIGEESRWYRDLPLSWLYSVLALDALAESRGIRCQWHISRMRPAWLTLYRFQHSVGRAIDSAGSSLDVHLDDHGFVVSLPDPKAVPRVRLGVRVWQQGETIVLMWHGRRRIRRADRKEEEANVHR